MYCDYVVLYRFTPLTQHTADCDITWLVRGDAEEGKDYDREALTWLWDVTTYADEKIIVDNWRGVRSRYYRPGPFSRMEEPAATWLEWILHELRRVPQFQ